MSLLYLLYIEYLPDLLYILKLSVSTYILDLLLSL